MELFGKDQNAVSGNDFKKCIRSYLLKSADDAKSPWRDKKALKETVEEVVGMDDDLLAYVHGPIMGQGVTETPIACEIVSISELVNGAGYTPVSAALFIQWYRRDPKRAAAFLLQHDAIVGIDINEKEDEADS